MKGRLLLIIFVIMLLSAFIFGGVYLYKYINKDDNSQEKVILSSNVEPFLFTDENVKLIYEGGPSHWGSRTITLDNIYTSENSKIVNLHVIDESDLKGDSPKKEWNQKWEAKSDGSLYIDDILMIKSPIVVGQNWNIEEYTPVAAPDKKYTANIKITSVANSLNDSNLEIKKIYTTLSIDDIKTVDGNVYTETREFESGKGLIKFVATEPTISDFTLSYWLDRTSSIE